MATVADRSGNNPTDAGYGSVNRVRGGIKTDKTITSLSGASQTLMAANTRRSSMLIVNTGNANVGVNPTGGTAAIGGAGTITLVPGGSYSPSRSSLSAITVIGTAGQPLYADESPVS